MVGSLKPGWGRSGRQGRTTCFGCRVRVLLWKLVLTSGIPSCPVNESQNPVTLLSTSWAGPQPSHGRKSSNSPPRGGWETEMRLQGGPGWRQCQTRAEAAPAWEEQRSLWWKPIRLGLQASPGEAPGGQRTFSGLRVKPAGGWGGGWGTAFVSSPAVLSYSPEISSEGEGPGHGLARVCCEFWGLLLHLTDPAHVSSRLCVLEESDKCGIKVLSKLEVRGGVFIDLGEGDKPGRQECCEVVRRVRSYFWAFWGLWGTFHVLWFSSFGFQGTVPSVSLCSARQTPGQASQGAL